jgi:hypothetical protein
LSAKWNQFCSLPIPFLSGPKVPHVPCMVLALAIYKTITKLLFTSKLQENQVRLVF